MTNELKHNVLQNEEVFCCFFINIRVNLLLELNRKKKKKKLTTLDRGA